jgi:putative serine protease PepD
VRFSTSSLRAALIASCAVLAACSSSPGTGPTTAPSSSATANTSSPPAGGAPLSVKALQDTFTSVAKSVLPEVVQIKTDQGLGSGIVYDGSGDIVTNAHVVGTSTSFQVTTAAGKTYTATLVGAFPPDDLAVVKVGSGASELKVATFADSSKLEIGDLVMAVGNPLGLQSSVTEGIVSATGRTVSEGNGVTIPDAVQTSAAINPGNSGGALVDMNGAVIGIPTLAALDQQIGGQAPGIGFAIPSNIVTDIAGQMIRNGGRVANSHRAYLGVRVATVTGGNGVLIARVDSGGPADKAGLQSGDVITAIDGKTVDSSEALTTILAQHKPGDQVKVTVVHADGSQATATVTLGQIPGS